MKQLLLLFCLVAAVANTKGQPYIASTYQSTYDTLVDFSSIPIEEVANGGTTLFWEKEIELEFIFPFFNEKYTSFIVDQGGAGTFNQDDYQLFLFDGDYKIIPPIDTPLNSDVRYAYLTVDSLDAVVIEWHDVLVADEYRLNGVNHTINYQAWFYENGDIEIHFGHIDLDSCSYYFPGEGYSFDNINPEGEIYGPWVGIQENDYDQSVFVGGDHQNPDIAYNDYYGQDVLTSLPPEGFVIKFERQNTSSVPPLTQDGPNIWIEKQGKQYSIQGNLLEYKSCTLYDVQGKLVLQTIENEFDVPSTSAGLLIASILTNDGPVIQQMVALPIK